MGFHGFDEFSELMEKLIDKMSDENVASVLEKGAEELAKDVRALPSPRRKGTGYTHLLDTVCTKRVKGEVEVGWGRYYGPFVEDGTMKMGARPHLKPTFEKNQERYYKIMTDELLSVR